VWDRASVLSVVKPLIQREASPDACHSDACYSDARRCIFDVLKCDDRWSLKSIKHIIEFRVFRGAMGIDNGPESGRFRRRCFGIEVFKVEGGEIGCNVADATIDVPPVKFPPVGVFEIPRGQFRPRHVMPPVVRREI
jgi:hypothetical protein